MELKPTLTQLFDQASRAEQEYIDCLTPASARPAVRSTPGRPRRFYRTWPSGRSAWPRISPPR